MVVFILVPKNSGLCKYREIALSFFINLDKSKIIEARGEDIPFWLERFKEKRKKAYGLTGEDLYKEYCIERHNAKLSIARRVPWNDENAVFGKPALCLIGPVDGSLDKLSGETNLFISSKYRNLAKRYLNTLESKGCAFRKNYLNGCIEASCRERIADLIVDIVYTGDSLRKNGLKVYDKIMESDFLILCNEEDEKNERDD